MTSVLRSDANLSPGSLPRTAFAVPSATSNFGSSCAGLGQMTCVPALSPPETERACSRCKHKHPQGYGWLPSLQASVDCRTDEVWRQLERQHQHVCQLPESLLQRYANDNRSVYKEHVLPTPRTPSDKIMGSTWTYSANIVGSNAARQEYGMRERIAPTR